MGQCERLKALAQKVADMRAVQKAYFLHRRISDLDRSKILEREIDTLLPDAMRSDVLLEIMESAGKVSALPCPDGRMEARRVVGDAQTGVIGSIVVGGGARKATVSCDGSDWRVTEWLD